MNISNGSVKLSADIDDSQLSNFTKESDFDFSFVNGKLNMDWNQDLDGSKWIMTVAEGDLGFTFETGDSIQIRFEGAIFTIPYSRKAGTIRFAMDTDKFFGVIEASTMRGEATSGLWTAVKE